MPSGTASTDRNGTVKKSGGIANYSTFYRFYPHPGTVINPREHSLFVLVLAKGALVH